MSQLLFWGANSHGQSGTGVVSEQFDVPTPVPFSEVNNIQQIAAGGGHSLICCTNGQVYASGWNNYGQLGLPPTQEKVIFFKQSDLRNLLKVTAGWDVSGGIPFPGVSHNQKAIFLGNKTYHQCSLSPTETLLDIRFGLRHTLVQFSDRVSLVGKSKLTEIVKTLPEATSRPFEGYEVLDIDITTKKIASGQHHILLLTSENEILMLGINKFGQCGRNPRFKHHCEVTDVFAGWTHSGLLDEHGSVYMWGRNCYDQLGQGASTAFSAEPLKVEIPEKVVDIQSGSEHVVARTVHGNVYCWGWNEHGNCGDGTTVNVSKPKKVELSNSCKLIGVGAGFTFALLEDKMM